jgi:response regulator RpfG family c-di-GMP phosphodiesterase
MEKTKILYLDDEENNLVAFKALFRREFDVFTTTSPQEAVAYLNENEVAIILSDQKMPGLSGVEFFELTLADFPNAVRIIVTGYADIEAVIDAINRGQVYRYVAKPWNENDLRVCLLNAEDRYKVNCRIEKPSEFLRRADLVHTKKTVQDSLQDFKSKFFAWKESAGVSDEQFQSLNNEFNALVAQINNTLDTDL